MDYIENRTFDELEVGESACLVRTLAERDIHLFAVMSGDVNPAHVDEEYAKSDMFHKIIAHGMWGGALISTVLGTQLPGPGTIYLGQSLQFLRPVGLGDTITVKVTLQEKKPEKHRVVFDCRCINQRGEEVITGTAEALAPTKKVRRQRVELPEVRLYEKGAHYRGLIDLTEGLEAIRMAIVHPVDTASLWGVVEAARADLISPILVGPEAKIRAAAETAGVDLSPYSLVPTEHSHAAAAHAVKMVRAGEVDSLMQGRLSFDELMDAVTDWQVGLRTERRFSHIFAMDVPNYARPLFLTDAAINIYPNLEDKQDIVQNAIGLLHALDVEMPKVALLSAMETVYPKIQSTIEAASLCKMAERGQIKGAVLDGPLTFGDAISEEAAQAKGIVSPVAGQADILVVPDLETGSMMATQLEYTADAQCADLVVGGRVPIVLTTRTTNSTLARMASCALAVLLTHHWRKKGEKVA